MSRSGYLPAGTIVRFASSLDSIEDATNAAGQVMMEKCQFAIRSQYRLSVHDYL